MDAYCIVFRSRAVADSGLGTEDGLMKIDRRSVVLGLSAVAIAVAGIFAVVREPAEAQQFPALNKCVKRCEADKNQCFRGSNKSVCRAQYQSCVLQCQRHLRK